MLLGDWLQSEHYKHAGQVELCCSHSSTRSMWLSTQQDLLASTALDCMSC